MAYESDTFSGAEKVADVLRNYPQLEDVFVEYGFKNITNPIMRRTVAKKISLDGACEFRGVDRDAFLAALDQALAGNRR
jgi:uncharacterized protein involved in response to NO